MAKSKLVEVNKKIEENVVGGYKKIEEGVVSGFNKIADKFVDSFLTEDGESAAEARERIAKEQAAMEAERKAALEQNAQEQRNIVEKNMQAAKNAGAEARKKAGLE